MGLEFRANDLTATLSNGSSIILAGATDYEEIQKLRGPKYGAVVLDEVQSMKTSVCRTLVADILEPATMDYDGTICAFFTPSASASGYAFDIDHTEDAWQRFHWTMLENPHLPKAKEWLEERKHENGWNEETPVYRREYLGEWIHDTETLVYSFDHRRNTCDLCLTALLPILFSALISALWTRRRLSFLDFQKTVQTCMWSIQIKFLNLRRRILQGRFMLWCRGLSR